MKNSYQGTSDCIFLAAQIAYLVKEGKIEEAITVLGELNPLQAVYTFTHIEEEITAAEYSTLLKSIQNQMNSHER